MSDRAAERELQLELGCEAGHSELGGLVIYPPGKLEERRAKMEERRARREESLARVKERLAKIEEERQARMEESLAWLKERDAKIREESEARMHWYTYGVRDVDIYVDAALRSSRKNEAYIFMRNEYVLVNYAPGTTGDLRVKGPLLISDGFPSLVGTYFAEWKIDAAFGCHDGNKAFVFGAHLCAYIDYATHTTDDKIIEGPLPIICMFPSFEGSAFESRIGAAFESTVEDEAFLFNGDQYALMNYETRELIECGLITERFRSLRGTIFESGIGAAFASHTIGEAYLFKEDSYTLIDFAADKIIGGVKKIHPDWTSLKNFVPGRNGRTVNFNSWNG